MADLKITLDTGNAAFDDGNGPAETARILRHIAARIEYAGNRAGLIHDLNGNTVGDWNITFPEPDGTP